MEKDGTVRGEKSAHRIVPLCTIWCASLEKKRAARLIREGFIPITISGFEPLVILDDFSKSLLTIQKNCDREKENAGGAGWLRNSCLALLDFISGEWNDPSNLSG
jgi:hypothetical protein